MEPKNTCSVQWQIEHIIPSKNHLGEGPVWHPDQGCLYWVDLFRNKVLRWSPQEHDYIHELAFEPMVSAVGLRKRGFILATNEGFVLSTEQGQIEEVLPFPNPLQTGAHSNDGAVDARGRFWAGTAAGPLPENHLYCVVDMHVVHTMETGIRLSNGIAWSPDQRTMYYVDSAYKVIYAYDFELETGQISNRRPFVHTPESTDSPDGITVDTEGCIWCARWDGWRVVRYTPEGDVDMEITLPVQRPTSCTFGGDDLSTLYVTSARTGLSAQQLSEQPHAGDVFAIKLNAVGFRENFFIG